jgi:hypothetical protein
MTPATMLGVGVKQVGGEFTGMLETAQTWSRLNSLPEIEGIGGDKSWDIHHINKTEIDDYIANSKTIKGKTPVTSSMIPSIVETAPIETTSTIIEAKSAVL